MYQPHLKAVGDVLPVCCCNGIFNLHFYRVSALQLFHPLWWKLRRTNVHPTVQLKGQRLTLRRNSDTWWHSGITTATREGRKTHTREYIILTQQLAASFNLYTTVTNKWTFLHRDNRQMTKALTHVSPRPQRCFLEAFIDFLQASA